MRLLGYVSDLLLIYLLMCRFRSMFVIICVEKAITPQIPFNNNERSPIMLNENRLDTRKKK